MKNRISWQIRTILFFIGICTSGHTQDNDRMFFQEVANINMIPTCMIQDRDGFIWIGTRGGLVKFDGHSLKIIRSGPNSLSGNHIVSMLEDSDGIIWLGINGGGVNNFDKTTGKIIAYPYYTTEINGTRGSPYQYLVQSMAEDNQGRIWIASSRGLSRYDKEKGIFEHYLHDEKNINSLLSNRVFSFFKDSNGFIWMGYDLLENENNESSPFDISRLDPDTGNFKHYDIIDNSSTVSRIKYISEDQDGKIWIACTNVIDSVMTHQLKRLDPVTESIKEFSFYENTSSELFSENIYQAEIFNLYPDYIFLSHEIFDTPTTIQLNIKTGDYIFYGHETKDTPEEQNPGFRYMIENKSGVLWGVDPFGKLFKHEPSFAKFEVLKKNPLDPNSIPSHKITRMIEDKDSPDIIWIGTLDRGLIKWNRKKDTFIQYPSIPGDTATLPARYIIGLADTGNGNVVIGSLSKKGKLSILDKQTNTFLKHLDISSVNDILPDSKDLNIVWCTGVGLGLIMVNIQTDEYIQFTNIPEDSTSISTGLSYWVIQDSNHYNHLWIATATGMNRFDKNTKQFRRYYHDPDDFETMPDMRINSISDNGDGTLWVCTAGGLAHFNKKSGKSIVYNKDNGFPTDFIYSVQIHNKILWIQSDIGIIKFNPKKPERIKTYGEQVGVTPFIYQGSLKTHDHYIFFSGSLNGPTYFHPDDIKANPSKPPVHLTSLKQGGVKLELRPELETIKTITLGWDENFFEFEYVALNYINQNKNHYQYLLEGFDNNWFNAGTKKFGRYSNLNGGSYILRIRGSNDDGIWSVPEQDVALKIIVKTPFWRAWWFYLSITLGVLSVICIFTVQRKRAGEALQKSEAKFRGLVESSSDWIWEVDAKGVYTYASPKVEAILGYKPEEVIGKTPFDLMPPEQGEQTARFFEDAAVTGESIVNLENINLRKDGHRVILETSGVPFFDEAGKVIGYRGVDRDITELRRAGKALNESEARYRTLVENAPEAIAVLDLDTGIFVDINENAVQLYGLSREQLLRSNPADVSPPNQPDGRSSREAAMSFVINAFEGNPQTFEWTHLNRKTGKKIFCEIRLVRLPSSERKLVRGSIVDITERKQQETELRNLRNYLYNIIDSMPSVLVGVDIDGRVTQWNKTAEQTTGITATAAQGKNLADVFPHVASEMEKITESIRTRKTKQEQKRPYMSENGTGYEDVTIYPLITNGVEGAVIRIDDVTNKVRMEEMMIQSEKMLSVGGLAAGMAHEINNPLSGIMQNAAVMADRLTGDLPSSHRAAEEAGTSMEIIRAFMDARDIPNILESIRKSGCRAAEIVANMLSFARKSDSTFSAQNMADLIDQTMDLAGSDYDLKKKYDFRQIEIIRKYDKNLPTVLCEAGKIRQVLLNILRNGAEAMSEYRADHTAHSVEAEAPRFVLRLAHEKEAGMVRIEIEDNGPGMDEETRKRIFEPFFTTKPVGQGTGLGLSVSYFIITENHRGEMAVESQPGVGANFIIHLPLKRITFHSQPSLKK